MHAYQLEEYGRCLCICHDGKDKCECGWPVSGIRVKKLRPATGRKEFKTRPFNRAKSNHRGESYRVISVMHQHNFHGERDVR